MKPVQSQALVKGRSATAPGHTKAAPEQTGKSAAAPGHTKPKTKPKAKLLPKPAKKAKPVAAKVKKAERVDRRHEIEESALDGRPRQATS